MCLVLGLTLTSKPQIEYAEGPWLEKISRERGRGKERARRKVTTLSRKPQRSLCSTPDDAVRCREDYYHHTIGWFLQGFEQELIHYLVVLFRRAKAKHTEWYYRQCNVKKAVQGQQESILDSKLAQFWHAGVRPSLQEGSRHQSA